MVPGIEMLINIYHLGVAIVAHGNTVIGPRLFYLIDFKFAVFPTRFRQSPLQSSTATAAAVIVRAVGRHVDKIFFTDNSLYRVSEIFGDGVPELFSHQITGIMDGEFFLQVLVPIRIDFQFAFPDPLCVVLDDALALEVVLDFEFLESGPDCEEFVPSFGVEPDLAAEIIDGLGF